MPDILNRTAEEVSSDGIEKPYPAVSVIIPAYNAARYLPAALDSILQQSFTDFEVIVIDDCSTDDTAEIIRSYASRDARIRTFFNENNLGIAGNRNKGVSYANGTYIVWQDADDISLPDRIKHQYELMECNPDVGIVGGYLELFRGNTTLGTRKYPEHDRELRKMIFRFSPVAQPAAMLRMEALKYAGEYDLDYPPAEDLDMTFRIGKNYSLANLQETVIRYRESDTSATATSLKKMELNTLAIRKKYSTSPAYRFTYLDQIYNALHYLSIWIVPSKAKIRIFNMLRSAIK